MSESSYQGSWTIQHFSPSNGEGPERVRHVPPLLRRVADTIEGMGDVDIQDITFGTEITADGPEHYLTVYFDARSSSTLLTCPPNRWRCGAMPNST